MGVGRPPRRARGDTPLRVVRRRLGQRPAAACLDLALVQPARSTLLELGAAQRALELRIGAADAGDRAAARRRLAFRAVAGQGGPADAGAAADRRTGLPLGPEPVDPGPGDCPRSRPRSVAPAD